ncbi:hypothetical protein F442_05929 [Phytophthora nicotianae P10297]|uniref:Uncharacterized protein n=2 Tax=Phytophthora nicotianae TaxID=4792 RepID=W2ZQ21_PHYNI|nr:hypothetical protein L916_14977 [Phytophthora nicotianae]ETP48304.1 hypothetical protein F442_05929 [Phytophthora nicotianae P10297]
MTVQIRRSSSTLSSAYRTATSSATSSRCGNSSCESTVSSLGGRDGHQDVSIAVGGVARVGADSLNIEDVYNGLTSSWSAA